MKLAAPADFIPPASNWRERSRHIASIGPAEFFHYAFSLRALAKLERGHAQDLEDVASFLRGGYVTAVNTIAEHGLRELCPADTPREGGPQTSNF